MATATELGARDYLVKPCEPQRILSAINAIVGQA
jgi:DNA-binding response OmpR family regulator